MTVKNVSNLSASVQARLQNHARASKRPFHELLQYYAMERFLYRLSKSRHRSTPTPPAVRWQALQALRRLSGPRGCATRHRRRIPLAATAGRWQNPFVTPHELFQSALALPAPDRVKLAAELLASVAPGEALSTPAWDAAWVAEVEQREVLEPDESLGAEHELPAVRQRLAVLFP